MSKQCELLSIHKSGLYYQPKVESEENIMLMKLIDEQYTKHPHMGVPSMTTWLQKDKGFEVNHKRIARLYKVMDICSLAPGPHTSKGCKEHKKYPYLLRNLAIERVHQVWATDITYIPMEKGFFYLMAIIDLKSRYILHWSISNSMEAEWCKQVMKECVEEHGKPEIVNTDQGAQYTSDVFTNYLLGQNIQISMDGKGRAIDNIFIERFWRSIKYEKIYLNVYENGQELLLGIIE
ncbi:MAG: IS3 family transposase, partial [Cytophagales bacterium]|nr:IS3 family transposase [Cytophagales bacterium]